LAPRFEIRLPSEKLKRRYPGMRLDITAANQDGHAQSTHPLQLGNLRWPLGHTTVMPDFTLLDVRILFLKCFSFKPVLINFVSPQEGFSAYTELS
jgi:hypothetical protein